MNKEKTAMHILIEELDVCISNLGSKNDLLTRCQKGRLVDAKTIAKRLLEKEQEQIEKAYEDGFDDGIESELGYRTKYENQTDYYQSKYGGEG